MISPAVFNDLILCQHWEGVAGDGLGMECPEPGRRRRCSLGGVHLWRFLRVFWGKLYQPRPGQGQLRRQVGGAPPFHLSWPVSIHSHLNVNQTFGPHSSSLDLHSVLRYTSEFLCVIFKVFLGWLQLAPDSAFFPGTWCFCPSQANYSLPQHTTQLTFNLSVFYCLPLSKKQSELMKRRRLQSHGCLCNGSTAALINES